MAKKNAQVVKTENATEEKVIGVNLPNEERVAYLLKDGTLQEIADAVDTIVKAQNEWLLDNDFTSSGKWNDTVDQLCGRYTNIQRGICFDACIATGNPMIEACKVLTFESIRVKESKDSETKLTKREVQNVDKDIDLLALHKYVKDGIGADKDWVYKLQKLNYLLAGKVGQAIGDPKWSGENLKAVSDSFVMHDIARAFDMGKNPTSNTQMLKTLTTIVQAMIGEEYKPTSHDVAWLCEAYSRKDRKAKTVQLPNHKTFALLLRDVCNNAITRTGYTADSKACKKQK